MSKLCACLLLLAACGCTAVYTTEPVGEQPLDITRHKDWWEGAWACDGEGPPGSPVQIVTFDTLCVRVVDSTNGLLQLAWVQRGSLEYKKADVWLRQAGDCTFATLRTGEETNRCLWAQIGVCDKAVLVWAPDGHKISGLVNSGQLPGCATNGVSLGHLGSNEFARLTSPTNDVLFYWQHPFVFHKVSK